MWMQHRGGLTGSRFCGWKSVIQQKHVHAIQLAHLCQTSSEYNQSQMCILHFYNVNPRLPYDLQVHPNTQNNKLYVQDDNQSHDCHMTCTQIKALTLQLMLSKGFSGAQWANSFPVLQSPWRCHIVDPNILLSDSGHFRQCPPLCLRSNRERRGVQIRYGSDTNREG